MWLTVILGASVGFVGYTIFYIIKQVREKKKNKFDNSTDHIE